MAEDQVNVPHECDGVGDDGWQNIGTAGVNEMWTGGELDIMSSAVF